MKSGCSIGAIAALALLYFAFMPAMMPEFASSPAEAAELVDIQRRGYLIVGVKDNSPPLGFRSSDGTLQGLEIDIARRLAADLLGRADAVMLKPLANTDRLSALLNGEVDVVIARLTVTSSRARLVDFSRPYYIDGTAILVRNSTIQRPAQLGSGRVAVLNGSSTIATVRSLLPMVQLVGVSSYQEAIGLLNSDQVQAVAADASILSGWAQNNPQYRLLPGLLSAEALSIAMPRGNQYAPLRLRVNDAIDRWLRENWLQERIDEWRLPY